MNPGITEASELDRLAAALRAAHTDRVPIEPLTEVVPGLAIADAYGIQRRLVKAWTDAGRRVIGRKIGLTSAAMQRQLGVDRPDFGVIVDDMLIEDGATVDRGRFIAPRIEPELAFLLAHDLRGTDVQPADVLDAARYVAPALEIIDSRITDWRISIADTIADNASSGAVVVGAPVEITAVRLRGMGCILRGDGEIRATGAGGAVLGSPLVAIAWLVRTLAEFGEGLRAGDLVIPGSMTPAQPATDARGWTADFEGAGRVRVEFEEAAA
jgi:2-keto-4-pentenoate hydratase